MNYISKNKSNIKASNISDAFNSWPQFTKEMKKTHTILIPYMLPIHFKMLSHAFRLNGYNLKVLNNISKKVIDTGLENVHNDTCYPCLIITGQFIDALKSGKYDLDNVALMMSQTGGGCRASNYIPLLKKALIKNNMPNIPIISINTKGMGKNSGFKWDIRLTLMAIYSILYGDLIMWISNQCKPYEILKGETNNAIESSTSFINQCLDNNKYKNIKKNTQYILKLFENIKLSNNKKVRVGIVGEIYLKYSALGNNFLEDFLINENSEPVISSLLDFLLYTLYNDKLDYDLYKRNKKGMIISNVAIRYLTHKQNIISNIIKEKSKFKPMGDFYHLPHLASQIIGMGTKMGEGWLLPAEILELLESGVNNIVCAQPFGCLPNHIIAKGMTKKIYEIYPEANICPIDYDPGSTKINQENRIKLMLATANIKRSK